MLKFNQLTVKLRFMGQIFTEFTGIIDVGIGVVVKQETGVMVYATFVLTSAEQNYSTTKKKYLAIVWALEK